MPDRQTVADHYTHGRLVQAIRDGVARLGKTVADVGVEDLGPVDEFHIGGRIATEDFLDRLAIEAGHHVLDVGCGLGGGARFAADRYGCRVTGVDLTPEFVETGRTLNDWVGLTDRIDLQVADAAALAQADGSYERAYMMHVGMNIADKPALARELYRVLRPGGRVGIYDVMQVKDGKLAFPLPWAAEPAGSALAPPAVYRSALQDAGFRITGERNRRDFALEFFAQLQARTAGAGGPPPLGLHILMGETARTKIGNMIDNISRELIAPVEIVAEKPA